MFEVLFKKPKRLPRFELPNFLKLANTIAEEMEENIPERTGQLKRSLTIQETPETVSVGVHAKHALAVESRVGYARNAFFRAAELLERALEEQSQEVGR